MFLDLLRSKTAGDPQRLQRALGGLRRYQEAPRDEPPEPMPTVSKRLGASLRDYGGHGPDLLFVPSLINPPTVLDLPGKSLLRWLAQQSRRVLLLDWGWPDHDRQGLSVAGHVEEILLPLMRSLPTAPDLAGYCLGGTMAAAAAQVGGARSLALIAAPWHFSCFGDEERGSLLGLWDKSRDLSSRLGVLPMEVLQCAFWNLDPQRTVSKFEDLAQSDPEAVRAFVTLEDWANDGPPLSFAAAQEMFERFFQADAPGKDEWQVAGQTMDPTSLPCPILNISSTTDRIVPAASAASVGERLDLARGHVGMIVGSRAREELWEPLAAWLSRVSPSC